MTLLFYSILIGLITAGIIGSLIIQKIDYYSIWHDVAGISTVILFAGAVMFLLLAGIAGGFGFSKETEIPISYQKALAEDGNSVTIIAEGQPCLFTQANVVRNYKTIFKVTKITETTP